MKISYVTFLIGTGVVATVVADVYLKRATTVWSREVFIGAMLYALIAIPVALAYRQISFSALFILWEGVLILIGLVIAAVWFGEPLTPRIALAALLSLAAMALVYFD